MKSIQVSDLTAGTIAKSDYCTADGKILISQGVIITPEHIQLLQRRVFTQLYVKEEHDVDEIKKLLSSEFSALGDVDFIEDAKITATETMPKALALPAFRNIKPGQEGLEQLNKSAHAERLDTKFKSGRVSDQPSGPGLKDNATELTPAGRTETYKTTMARMYEQALWKVETILDALADGEAVDGPAIRSIVEKFVTTFVTDRNILICLSTTRSANPLYVYSHSLNVCLLAINIAASRGYNREQVIEVGMGALLFDVGMLLVPRHIYLKKGRLTKDELFEIQKHPILGLHLLENITRLPESIPYIAYQGHERENATGYPKKRDKRLTHCFSKIVQIADIYIALTSPRPYREPYLPYTGMEMIIKMMRMGLVSGEFVKALLCYTSLFPVGSLVELSDNSIGKVIKANATSYAKPVVTVLTTKSGELLPRQNYFQIDLSEETSLQIVKAHKRDFLPAIDLMDGF